MNFVQVLWSDESGSILTTETVLLGTVVVVGTTVGVHQVADAVNAELGEVSGALRSLDQSYSFKGFKSCKAETAGSSYTQPERDECEPHHRHEEHKRHEDRGPEHRREEHKRHEDRREEHKRHEDRRDDDKRDNDKKPESRHEDRRDNDKRDDDKKPEMRRDDNEKPEPRTPRRPEYPRRPENKRTEDAQPEETKPVDTGKPQPGGN